MEFKIIKHKSNEKELYELWFFDEFHRSDKSWKKVIWDMPEYRNSEHNFTDTVEKARQKAAEFKEAFDTIYGIVVETFTL